MTDVSSLASSPSLYSRRGSHINNQPHGIVLPGSRGLGVFADSDYDSEEEDSERSRLSMVSGPKVRKFTDTPWDAIDESDAVSTSGGISRMLHAAKSRTQSTSQRQTSPTGSTMTGTSTSDNTRKAMALFGKGKQLFPSSSGASLASSHTVSTTSDHLVTPKLKSPFGSTSPSSTPQTLGDHGHMSRDVSEETLLPSKSARNMFDHLPTPGMPTNPTTPGFGLISLEQAQEREKTKSHKRTGTAHKIANVLKPDSKADTPPLPNRVKAKKSGIMKMFNKDKATGVEPGATLPKLPTPPLSSSLRAVPHPSLPRPSDTSDAASVRSGATSLHSPLVIDKPLPPPHISPPKKSKDKRSKEPPRLLGDELHKPRLELRPVSMNFSNGFASDYLAAFGEEASSGASSPAKSNGPLTPSEASFSFGEPEDPKDQLANARKAWRLQQYEFEAQIRDLHQQLEDARKPKPGGCDSCGCVCGGKLRDSTTGSVMDRARAKTGGARFGTGSLYE